MRKGANGPAACAKVQKWMQTSGGGWQQLPLG